MRTKRIKSIMITVAVIVALCELPAFAQDAPANQKNQVKTDSKMAYHNGPIMTGVPDVFFIWYGTWDDNADNMAVQFILTDFVSNVGGSPYFQINAMYPNGSGGAPSGATANSQSKHGGGCDGINVGAIAKQSDN